MPSTYTLNNGIELIATGEQSGTWGDTTNTNFELLDTALDGQVSVTLSATGSSGSPNTLPISDGASSNGRNRLVIFSDGGDLGGTAFVQLTPNDAEKIIYVRNNLSGSRSILLFQGTYNASNDYEVPAGTTAVVFFDGAGSGAVAANVFNNAFFDSLRLGSVSVTAILDEDNMASNSATALSTQQSIKAYVDAQVGTVDTLAEILANGNTTGGNDIVFSAGDNITNASGDLTLDVAGDIILDGDGASIRFKDNAVEYAHHYVNSNSYYIRSVISDADIIFQGNDGGVTTTVLTLDMSNAGFASFNNGITLKNELYINNADASATAGYLYNDSNNFVIRSYTQDKDIIFKGNDGGSVITALTLDMSAEGNATFQSATTARISLQKTGSDKANIFFDTSNGLQFDNSSYNYPIKFDGSSFVFNEQSNDSDFRVESNNNANMLFVDAGADHVNIGIGSDRGGVLNVYGTGTPIAVIESEADGTVLSLRTTDTDANAGPNLELYRNATGAASDNLGSIIVKGTDASAQDQVYFSIGTQISAAGNGVEASTVYFQNAVAGTLRERITISSSALVINQEGLDNDFRVESDGNANMFVVDAGNNRIGIGEAAPDAEVHIGGAHPHIDLGPKSLNRAKLGFRYDNLYLGATAGGGEVILKNNISSTGAPDASGDEIARFGDTITFNESGRDQDFRVESDNDTHALFVDAANDAVCINTSSILEAPLNIQCDASARAIRIAGRSDDYAEIDFFENDNTTQLVRHQAHNSYYQIRTYAIPLKLATNQIDRVVIDVAGNVTFNDTSTNSDFTVESDGNANMLFLDASANKIGIGSSSFNYGTALTVHGNEDAGTPSSVFLRNSGTSGGSGNRIECGYVTGYGAAIRFSGNPSSYRMYGTYFERITGDGPTYATSGEFGTSGIFKTYEGVVHNENGNDRDFRVESNGNANMLTVDGGNNLVSFGKFGGNSTVYGGYFSASGSGFFHQVLTNTTTSSTSANLFINRQSSDGQLIQFRQADSTEGNISVSGSTVSYNGFSGRHESSGIPTNTPIGTVVSTIDELDVYPNTTTDIEGNTITHKKAGQTRADHPKVEVSSSEGDSCVYGIVSEFDDDGKLIVTSVGIGSVRVTGSCAKGDLLESNGDGTAKVQSDDIVRSKTLGKVTIGNSDTGVKLVSCVMYCG